MSWRRGGTILIPVPPESPDMSRIIVIRAWRDGDDVRVRLLIDDDRHRAWVVTGAAAAAEVVRLLLAELESAEPPGEFS